MKDLKELLIEESANKSVKEYISYILNGRVLPRLDGLKPVQRRVLWAMQLMGCRKKFRKSAIIIGEAMKYHAHGNCLSGDTLVYSPMFSKPRTIEDIYESEVSSITVYSYDEKTKMVVPAIAHSFRIGKYVTQEDDVYEIEFYNGGIIRATKNHPFLVNGEWKQAKNIRKRDIFYSKKVIEENSGYINNIRISSKTEELKVKNVYRLNIEAPMYDFTVDKYENMLVYSSLDKDVKSPLNGFNGDLIVAHNSSIYTALINLVNSPNHLVEGQGNWGSEEDPQAAAERYTEAKTSDLFEALFDDSCLNKELGDFVPNFSEDELEPYNLQFKLPLSRLIGVNGIGMGFSTSCPALSFSYLRDFLYKTMENPEAKIEDPEFAYGGSEYRGIIYPSMEIEELNGKNYLHITDIPLGSTKVKMNKSPYIRALVLSDQMEIIDKSDVLNYKQPISIYLRGPKSALKLVIDSMRRRIPDYLYFYNNRLRNRYYESEWLDFRRNFIAKREYFTKESELFTHYQRKSLTEIALQVENSTEKVEFQRLAEETGRRNYREYLSKIIAEEAKCFQKTEEKFISSLIGRSISSVKRYELSPASEIVEFDKTELNNMIVKEIDELNPSLFSNPTKKIVRLLSLENHFSSNVKKYVALRNWTVPQVSFKPIPRLMNWETEGDVYTVYDDGTFELLDEKFLGEVRSEEKNVVGFMISDLPTVFITVSNNIICYKRISKIGEIIKSAFPACRMMIDGKKRKMRAGLALQDVKDYKILGMLED